MKNILEIVQRLKDKLSQRTDGTIDFSKSDRATVVVVFVKFEEEILLLKRSDKVSTYQGKWQGVAGFLDEAVSVREKVLEELKEEVGIVEEDISNWKIGEYFEQVDSDLGKTWIVQPVLVKLKEKKEIILDWEHTDYKWIDPNNINNYSIVPNVDEVLKRVL